MSRENENVSEDVGNHLCHFSYRKDEFLEEQKVRRENEGRRDATVWVRREGRNRIRRTSHRMCLRITRENEYMEQNFVRTELWTYRSRGDEARLGECTEGNDRGHSFLGKFNFGCSVHSYNWSERLSLVGTMKGGMGAREETIQYRDVVIGDAKRRLRVVRRRGIEGNGGRWITRTRSRMRQRTMVPISQFKLFLEQDVSNDNNDNGRGAPIGQDGTP